MDELKAQIKEECFFILALIHRHELTEVDVKAMQEATAGLCHALKEVEERMEYGL